MSEINIEQFYKTLEELIDDVDGNTKKLARKLLCARDLNTELLAEVQRLREQTSTWASGYRNTAKLVTKCEKKCTCGASEVFADGY